MKRITLTSIDTYISLLETKERSPATLEKYRRDILKFYHSLPDRVLTREAVLAFKAALKNSYKASSTNSILTAVNGFLDFFGCPEYRVRLLKIQKQLFIAQNKELTKEDYLKLVRTAQQQNKQRLSLILQTLCATGIRISELSDITAAGVRGGRIEVQCKNKIRVIFIPAALRSKMLSYMKKKQISQGPVFVTRSGRAVNRVNVWQEMKELAGKAGVDSGKVYPHNLRHLFARTYYSQEKDIWK